MSSMQSFMACIAALMIPTLHVSIRPSRKPARARARAFDTTRLLRAPSVLVRAGIMAAAMVMLSLNYAAAQDVAAAPDATTITTANDPCEQCNKGIEAKPYADVDPSSDSIMGFENKYFWATKINGVQPDSNVTTTTVRTQGNVAYTVFDPANYITVTSIPVDSSARSLTGIGKRGALLQLDVQVQLEPASGAASALEQRDADVAETTPTTNATSIEAFVSSRSRGLNKVSLGKVSFQKLSPNMYHTVGFSVPQSVGSALEGAKFDDLIFEFVISAAGKIDGAYLFDNLRVHSVELVQSPQGEAPPAGYGSSLNLFVAGNTPLYRKFGLSPAQIPSGFHLKQGTTGKTTVQFQLGLDASPQLTCSYIPQGGASSSVYYVMKSCSGNYRAGDLVQANWLSLRILNGVSSQQLQGQLALSPLGDLTGSGLIPPMPTYWGDANACLPAPAHGKVVTTSTSCARQRAQANQILTDYFEAVKSAHPTADWVVAPVPYSAQRMGNITPLKALAVGPQDAGSNVPFDTGGDLNPGGSFDAYWQLSGNLNPTGVTGTDENLTHFDAAFTTHGVLFGEDVDVVDATVTADTDSGETQPVYKPATSTGTLGFYVFGEEIPSGGLSFSPSAGFSVDPSWSQEYDLPSIQIWIFDITLGALVNADLKVSGSAALTGADLSVVPTAALGGHISGGISLGIADGSVDARVNLITLSAPASAQAKFVIDNRPQICATTLNGSLKGDLDVSTGGGEVNLDATFGVCPFCYTDSYTLFKWGALGSTSYNLFNDTLAYQAFGLPASLCPLATTVNIISPVSGASLSSGVPTQLTGSATPNDSSVPYTSTYQWKFTPGANASTVSVNPTGANSASPVVTFGAPTSGTTSTWTIGLTATTTVHSQGGTVITKTVSATPVNVTVTSVQPGDYITQVVSQSNGPATADPGGFLSVGGNPGAITIFGAVAGATSNLNTTFAVFQCNDQTPACSNPGPSPYGTITTSGGDTTSPSAYWDGFSGGFFQFTMSTTSGGATVPGASVVIGGWILQ